MLREEENFKEGSRHVYVLIACILKNTILIFSVESFQLETRGQIKKLGVPMGTGYQLEENF